MKKRFVELIGDRGGVFFEDKFYVRLPIAEEAAIDLATEWAAKEQREQAIAFAEWAYKSGWEFTGTMVRKTIKHGKGRKNEYNYAALEELYTIFNNQQK